jgi:hypothetical protein
MFLASFRAVCGVMIFGVISHCLTPEVKALEILATWASFGVTPGQTSFTAKNGTNGTTNNFFSDLSMTFQNMVGSNTASLTNPSFDQIQGTANGNPATTGGQFIQLNFTKAPAFANYSFTISNIIVRFANDEVDPGNSQSEVHFYSSTGAPTPFVNGTANQMNSTGTGIVRNDSQGVPATPLNFPAQAGTPGTMQFNQITEAASSYQIRMAPDSMSGNDPHWAMASFSGNYTVGLDTLNFPANTVIGIVGTWSAPVPEPSTYILSTIAVGTIAILAKRRKRNGRTL